MCSVSLKILFVLLKDEISVYEIIKKMKSIKKSISDQFDFWMTWKTRFWCRFVKSLMENIWKSTKESYNSDENLWFNSDARFSAIQVSLYRLQPWKEIIRNLDKNLSLKKKKLIKAESTFF